MLAIARQSAAVLLGAVLLSPSLQALPGGGEEDNCVHLLGYGGTVPPSQTAGFGGLASRHGGLGRHGGVIATGICAVDNARLNRGSPFKTNADFVPVTGDDTQGFYCVYGVKASTTGGVGGNVGIFLFELSSGEVLLFGSGYGNIQGANLFDAAYDMERVDQVIRFCMGKDPATTAIRMVAPHGHGDHINPACNRELERLGYRILEIAFHQGDFTNINNMAWTSADRALFRVIPPSTNCLEEQLSYASPAGKIWFFDRPGHTPGSIDLVLDVLNDPANRFVVRGSQPSASCAPLTGQREVINAHGNVELTSTAPTVTDVTPLVGPALGGTPLTITGTDFTASGAGTHRVLIDGVAATNVVVVNNTTLTCSTPAGQPGQLVQIAVVNNNGKSTYSGTFFFNALPTLTSVTPASGDWRGGTVVQVRGSGFLLSAGTNEVFFGASRATNLSVKSDTLLTCRTPLGTPGSNVSVLLRNPNGEATLSGTYRYNADVAILGFTPTSSTSLGGTVVTLTGTSFTGNGSTPLVTFDGVPALDVTLLSDTSVSATAPDGQPGTLVEVALTNSAGNAVFGGFRYHALPEVSSLLPSGGTSLGGTSVTLSGSGFVVDGAGPNQVRFGGIPATDVQVLADGTLTCRTPPGVPGETANVTVTNLNGTATLPSAFTYAQALLLQALLPVSGSAEGGTLVTLTGRGFLDGPAGTTSVSFGGVPASAVNVLSDSSLTCVAPAAPPQSVVAVEVTNDNGTVALPSAYRYHTVPTLLSIAPDHGHAGAFTQVTITGSGFMSDGAGSPLVVAGGFTASDIEVVNDTTVQCVLPQGAPGSLVDIILANSNGSDSLAGAFRYHTAPSLSSASPESGSADGQLRITLTGSGFALDDAGTPTVTFGGLPATGISVLGDQTLRCNAPVGTPGQTVAVALTNLRGGATLPGAYRFHARPSLGGASPVRGTFQGGTTVTLSGLGFVKDSAGTNTVTFGGLAAGNLSVLNDTSLTCTSPPNTLGSVVDIVLSNTNGTTTLASGFSYAVAAPAVTLVTPGSGPASAPGSVQLTGTGFLADAAGTNTVTFGGLAASNVIVVDNATLTCQVPPGTPGSAVEVVVTNANGSGQLAGGFRYHARPALANLLPASASALGGTLVRLTGSGFLRDAAGANSVLFGGIPASEVLVVDDTRMTCLAPAGAPGATVEVLVSNANGQAQAASFAYHARPSLIEASPAFGPALGGAEVTLTGSGFLANDAGVNSVRFGNRGAADVVVLNDSTLTCVAPSAIVGTVDLEITNANGSALLPQGFRYGKVPPVITSIEPASGSSLGKNLVTIRGTGFEVSNAGLNRVKFGTVLSNNVITLDDETVYCTAPAGAPGGRVDVALNNNSGTSVLGQSYRYHPLPTLLSVSPSEGKPLAMTRVTLTGTGFVANSAGTPTVFFNQARARDVVVLDDTRLVCTATGGSPGTVMDVTVLNTNGSASLADAYRVLEGPPGIRSVDPQEGPFVGGTRVTIEGSGFLAKVSRVTFDTVPALDLIVESDTRLTCVTPAGTLGKAVTVMLRTQNGIASVLRGFTYGVVLPELASISPVDGPASGSTRVTLNGSGFAAPGAGQTIVTFGGSEAVSVVVEDDATVTCISPAGGQATTVAVKLRNDYGTSELPGAFRYHARPRLTGVDPARGPASGGTTLTLTGTGFQVDEAGASLVLIGGVLASDVNRLSDTTLTCTTPAGIPATTVSIQLSNRNGTTDLPNSFRYNAIPKLLSLSPTRGPIQGGTSVTLTGTGFFANSAGTPQVTFGGVPALEVAVANDTTLTCTTPPGTTGAVAVALSNVNGSASLATGFTYFVPPGLTSLTPARGSATGGTPVTMNGSGFQAAGVGTNLVLFGGVAALDVVVQSDARLTCTTPSGIAGTDVDVEVVNGNGTALQTGAFHYHGSPVLASLTPDHGPASGAGVTLSGSGFLADGAGTNVVTFGGASATALVVVDDTTLTCTAPALTPGTVVGVTLTNDNGSSTLAAAYRAHARPTLSAVAPARGPNLGGTSVTLTGTGFVVDAAGTPQVRFGGVLALAVAVVDDTTLTCSTPPGTAGAVAVALTNANGSASLANGFTYVVPPALTSLTPTRGPATGGTQVTLSGAGFQAAGVSTNLVSFGGVPALNVVVQSNALLTCTTPPGVAGTDVDVEIGNENGTARLSGAFHYHGSPVLTSLTPDHGPASGASVTLSGSGFLTDSAGTNLVTVGGVSATAVVVVNDTTLTCTTPARPPGAVFAVTLTNDNGSSTLAAAYRTHARPTLSAVAPSSGPNLGGTGVTLTGTGFVVDAAGTPQVTFGGVPALTVAVVNDTTLTCTTPPGTAGAVAVALTNTNGSASLASGFAYVVPPTLTSLTPTRGPATGGTQVTLNGAGFQAAGVSANLVFFGGVAGLNVVVQSDALLTCSTPPGVAGTDVDVEVRNENGTARRTGAFHYHGSPVLTSLTPDHGPTSGTSVTLSGSGFVADAAGTNLVTFGGVSASAVVVVNDTTLTCTTPTGTPGAVVGVTLTNNNGASTLAAAYRTHARPTLSGVAPATGSSLGGTSVTLTGTGFVVDAAGVPQVTIGGVPALSIVVLNDTTLTCATPPGTPGAVAVALTNTNGSATLAAGFNYNPRPTLTAVAPTHGSQAGGTLVTLTGTRFSTSGAGPCTVLFGAAPATSVTTVSDSTLTCLAPPGTGAASVDVRVSNANGSALASAAYRYDPLPSVASVSPTHGPALGGTVIVITGSRFADPSAGATSVSLGGLAATGVIVLNDTQIQCTVPPGGAGSVVEARVANAIGAGSLASAFRYHAAPVVTSVAPDTGSSVASTTVTLTGSGFLSDSAGPNAVQFGAGAATNVSVIDDTSLTCDVAPQAPGTTVDVRLSNANGASLLAGAFAFDAPAPTLAAVAPTSGVSLGGTPVSLTGSGFLNFSAGTNAVSFGGAAATGVVVQSDTLLDCVTPAGTPGASVDVTLGNANGSAQLSAAFTYFAPAPSVTSVSPSGGPSVGGGVVTLTGSGFQANAAGTNTVTFGGLPAGGVSVIDDSTLTCSVPAGVAGTAVEVALGNANGAASLPAGYRYHALPSLTSISPGDGTSLGGTLITVLGSGFLDDAPGTNVVLLDGKPVNALVVFEDGRLTFRAPSGVSGAIVSLSLTNDNGSAQLSDAYRYHEKPTVTSVAPPSGPSSGTNRVTINGNGFLADGAVVNIVSFGGITATGVSVLTNSTLECNVPAGTSGRTVQITVANVNGTALLPAAYRYHDRPTVTGVSPANGPEAGGATVTLSGSGFSVDSPGTNSVTFGGVAASSVAVLDDTQLTCLTPAGTAGAVVDVVLTNANGAGTLFGGFQYDSVPVPLVTSSVPSKGSTQGSTQVTLLGSGFEPGMSVTFAGSPAQNVVVVDENTIRCSTPTHALAAWVDIAVEGPESGSSLALGFQYVAPPELTSIQPPIGLPQGGSMVVLEGSGFLDGAPGENLVTFGGRPALNVMVLDDQHLVCEAPTGPALTNADVVVVNDIGTARLDQGFRWQLRLATDLDSDGRGDLILTSQGDDTVANDAGAVRIFFGSAGPSLDRYSVDADLLALPDRASMDFGIPVASGDLDGDGHAELVIGAPGDDKRSRDAGSVFVFAGPQAPSPSALTPDQARIELFSSLSGTRFGSALLLRDFDRDGILDLLVGAPGRTGSARLFLGSSSGLASSPAFTVPGASGVEGFATSLGAGDLDGDGWVDLVVGAPTAVGVGGQRPGKVRVFRGGPSAFQNPNPQPWLVFAGLQDGEGFGTAVTVADLSGDGIADLVVGAPSSALSGTASGAAYVFFGRADLTSVDAGQADAIVMAEGPGDLLGASLAAGEVNGDGRPDLLLGAPGHIGAGRAYLFLGAASFTSTTASEADIVLEPEAGSQGEFGSVVALVDVDGNGLEDIVVSAPGLDMASSDLGRVYFFSAPSAGVLQAEENDGTVTGSGAGDRLGRSLSADH